MQQDATIGSQHRPLDPPWPHYSILASRLWQESLPPNHIIPHPLHLYSVEPLSKTLTHLKLYTCTHTQTYLACSRKECHSAVVTLRTAFFLW